MPFSALFLPSFGTDGLIGPSEIPLDINDVGARDDLLHFRAIGRGRREFNMGAGLGGRDAGAWREPALAADFLLQRGLRFLSALVCSDDILL
jgi:hypothetical protein